jgi:hypothetical protein
MEPTKFQIELYKKLFPILGISPKIVKYGDEKSDSEIRILSCPDPIDEDVMFFSTIGLSEIIKNKNSTEIFFTSYTSFSKAANILSTTAFFIINNGWIASDGAVFETLIEMYYPNKEMKHLYFTMPYLWEDKLEDFSVENKKVNFLLAIPISDKELAFKNKYGFEKFENLFQEKEVDIFDLDRKSTI